MLKPSDCTEEQRLLINAALKRAQTGERFVDAIQIGEELGWDQDRTLRVVLEIGALPGAERILTSGIGEAIAGKTQPGKPN